MATNDSRWLPLESCVLSPHSPASHRTADFSPHMNLLSTWLATRCYCCCCYIGYALCPSLPPASQQPRLVQPLVRLARTRHLVSARLPLRRHLGARPRPPPVCQATRQSRIDALPRHARVRSHAQGAGPTSARTRSRRRRGRHLLQADESSLLHSLPLTVAGQSGLT